MQSYLRRPAGGRLVHPVLQYRQMENIRAERSGNVAILTLGRGKANALNSALVNELYTSVVEAGADDAVRGLVLASDRPNFFSAGFDIREVFTYDRDGMAGFFGRFIDLYESLYRFPKPVVAALSGHTFAGGAILAISCDFRVMADGEFGFALNEINLGLAVTPTIRRMVVDAVGTARASEILLFGEPLTPARALQIGLVRDLAPTAEVRDRAIAMARTLAAKPPNAYREIKRSLRGADGSTDRVALDKFLEVWFSDEARQARASVTAGLRS